MYCLLQSLCPFFFLVSLVVALQSVGLFLHLEDASYTKQLFPPAHLPQPPKCRCAPSGFAAHVPWPHGPQMMAQLQPQGYHSELAVADLVGGTQSPGV